MNVPGVDVPSAFRAERMRQIAVEHWTPAHDDRHADGSLLITAMMYYRHGAGLALPMHCVTVASPLGWKAYAARRRLEGPSVAVARTVPIGWPWHARYWKPKTPARDLERAGALCLAEIERQRRADPDCDVDVVEIVLRDIVKAYRALAPEVTS